MFVCLLIEHCESEGVKNAKQIARKEIFRKH